MKPAIEVSLHPSGWLKVKHLEFLGSLWPDYAHGCMKAGATKKMEKHEKFFLILPSKANNLMGELEHKFQLTFTSSAEAYIHKEEQDRKDLYEEIEENIRISNKWLDKLEPPSSFHPYQRSATHWLASRRAGLLSLPEGSGKTPIGLLMVRRGSLVIIICPTSVQLKWAKNIKEWRGPIDGENLRITVYKSTNQPVKLNPERSSKYTEFHIFSYKTMPERSVLLSVPFYNKMPTGSILIIDEAHYAKNMGNAVRADKTKDMATVVMGKGGNVYPFTSTPVDKNALELFNILALGGLEIEAFGDIGTYKRLNNCKEGAWGTEWGDPSPEIPKLLEKVAIIKRKEEIMPFLPKEMPPIILPVEVQLKASKKFDAMWDRIQAEVKRGLPLPEVLHRIRQGRLGISFTEYSSILAELARQKIPFMKEEIKQHLIQEEPLIVASCHLDPLYALAEMDEGEGPWGTGFPIITGKQKAHERQRIVEAFQSGSVPVLGISVDAAGQGIDLYRGHYILHVDTHWSEAANRQLRARTWRMGQEYPCFNKYLLANHPLDWHLHEVNHQKSKLTEALMFGSPEAEKRKVSKEEWQDLLRKVKSGVANRDEKALVAKVYRRLQGVGGVSNK